MITHITDWIVKQIDTHRNFYVNEPPYIDDNISCARTHINVIQKDPQPFHKSGIYIWLDGEFYNQSELGSTPENISDAQLLLNYYKNEKEFSFLRLIDGIYSAVIYDSNKQKVHIIIDRYGLRHIYWARLSDCLVWCSEAKGFLAFQDFSPRINRKSVEDFFSVGYLLENRTWFDGVELLPSGTVLSFDLRTKNITNYRYWWWDDISVTKCKLNEKDIIEELERLFVNAVELRCRKNEKIGLTLSGGLDSRAIMAALPHYANQASAVTFGKIGCDDIKIAAQACKVKGIKHYIFYMNKDNWLYPRIEGVWWTDGLKNLQHMNGLAGIDQTREIFDINLDGFLGDALVGGSYLNDKKWSLVEKCDNRGRRFIIMGQILREKYVQQRFPFFDNKLVEFVLAIPPELRVKSYIYNKMLLKAFPSLFKTIPWQNTGFPISYPRAIVKGFNALIRVHDLIASPNRSRKYEYSYFAKNKYFTDIPNWLRQEPANSFVLNLLSDRQSLYYDYIERDKVMGDIEAHSRGQDKSEQICLYISFEIWLRQVYKKEFRDRYDKRHFS